MGLSAILTGQIFCALCPLCEAFLITGFAMRFDYFSIIGYLSVIMWLAVPVLWVLHAKTRPRKWLVHIALGVAVAAFVFAKINSRFYVNKIQIDMSEQMAEWQAKQDAKLKEAEKERSGDVADVRFVEDAAGEYLDKAGMDDSDLKYMESLNEAVPAWKKQKRQRSATREEDDSLEALIGAKEQTEGVEGAEVENAAKAPVQMPEKDKMRANTLDGLNLKITRLMILLGLVYLVGDYLHRANSYDEAYLPLPVPSTWLEGMAPAAALMKRSGTPRRSISEELAWLTNRGDSFIYMSDKPEAIEKVPEKLPGLFGKFMPKEVIRVDSRIDDKFIFESLWYGRSSFAVDSSERAIQMLGQFVAYLSERKASRARVRQTAHIIWDVTTPLSEEWQEDFAKLMKATGMTLVVCQA